MITYRPNHHFISATFSNRYLDTHLVVFPKFYRLYLKHRGEIQMQQYYRVGLVNSRMPPLRAIVCRREQAVTKTRRGRLIQTKTKDYKILSNLTYFQNIHIQRATTIFAGASATPRLPRVDQLKPNSITLSWSQTGARLVADLLARC